MALRETPLAGGEHRGPIGRKLFMRTLLTTIGACPCLLVSFQVPAWSQEPSPGPCQSDFMECRARAVEQRTPCRLGCPSDPVADCGVPPLPDTCLIAAVRAMIVCRQHCAAQSSDNQHRCVRDFNSCRAQVATPTPTPG